MHTIKVIVAAALVMVAAFVQAGDSAPFLLDTVTTTTSPVVDSISVSWDASWIGGDAGATVVIADNGTEVKRTTGAGEFAYTFADVGRHELTYTTYIGALAQDEVYVATCYSGWKYEELDDGVVITESTQKTGNIAIPSVVDGKQVVGIASSAFSGCGGLTSVSIPDGVTSIGESAFYGCNRLASVTVPDSVTIIGIDAFGETPFYDNLPDGLVVMGKVAYRMKGTCPNSVAIPEGVVSVSDGAFSGCSGLKSVIIPDCVTIVGRTAFAGCDNIRSASIPMSLKVENMRCGMIQARFDAANAFSPSILDSETRAYVSGVLMGDACATASSSPVYSDPIYGGSYQWDDYTTYGYYGYMHMEAGKQYVFGKYFDDSVYVKGDGVVVLNDTDYQNFATGTYVPQTTGWHELEVRVADSGRADKGPYGAFSGASASYWSSALGVGWRDDGVTDALPESGWHKLMDNGSGRLLRAELDRFQMSLLFPDAYDRLESVTIVENSTEVPAEAFSGCASLNAVVIPMSVTNVGVNAFAGCSSLKNVTVPQCVCSSEMSTVFPAAYSSITNVVVCEGTTTIGNDMFYGCIGLKSVTIPDSLTRIGSDAFYGCSALTSVTIPSGVTSIRDGAFSYCGGLTSVTIPNSVTSIGSYAFSGCGGLKNVTIPQCVCSSRLSSVFPSAYQSITNVVVCDGTTSIWDSAFSGCRGLTSITIPSSVTSIASSAFSGCSRLTSMVIPESVKSIGDNAFSDCRSLTSVTIPGSVTSIGSYAFYKCTELTSVTIPGSVKSIGDNAFDSCRSLTSVTILNGVTSIGSRAFFDCWMLTSVTIPVSVTSIGNSAFSGCSSVRNVEIPQCVCSSRLSSVFTSYRSITNIVICGGTTIVGDNAFDGCTYLKSVSIPETVTGIGSGSFANCNRLESLTIPATVMQIGERAFAGCERLVDIETIPNIQLLDDWVVGSFGSISGSLDISQVRGVAASAFYGCDKITEIRFGDTMRSIGSNAFAGCNGLTSVIVPNSVMLIGEGAFGWCRNLREISLPFVGSRRGNAGVSDSLFGWIFGSTGYLIDSSSYAYYDGEVASVKQWHNSSSGTTYYIPNSLVKVAITDESTIGFGAFGGCENIVDVSLSVNVGSIGGYAFSGCSGLKRLRMEGDAPSVGLYAFLDVNEICCARVHETSSGWGVEIPGVWNGISIRYIEERVSFVAVPVIEPPDGTVLTESPVLVTISCETDGAEIFYTLSGKTPKISESNRYKGPFTITNTVTVKAVAVYDNGETSIKSDYATAIVTMRTLTLGEAASADAATASLDWSTGGNGNWTPIVDGTALSGMSAKSGAIQDGGQSWMATSVSGAGTFNFKWKTDCEWDDSGDATWDHLAVFTNGIGGTWVEVARIDGNTPWSDMSIAFAGNGVHVIRWEYSKDESDL